MTYPCPFCKSELTYSTDRDRLFFVRCLSCHAEGPKRPLETDAKKDWKIDDEPDA